jgi:hypothetical protein
MRETSNASWHNRQPYVIGVLKTIEFEPSKPGSGDENCLFHRSTIGRSNALVPLTTSGNHQQSTDLANPVIENSYVLQINSLPLHMGGGIVICDRNSTTLINVARALPCKAWNDSLEWIESFRPDL